MASIINKRQQARNEKALQELVQSVPGNDRCADCQARNPGWASWSLGIFLCMRCAALHRKLGTHISKVKSLSMDTWSNDQVEKMKQTGNNVSNQLFNPRNIKPNIPVDSEEVDIALEKFIRDKYQRRNLGEDTSRDAARRRSPSTASTDDQPPPLPPKTASRFGASLRSSSATISTSSRNDKNSSPALMSKETQRARDPYEGATLEQKLARLRDMGFKDEKRNSTVLKGHGGNVQKAIDTLVRLSEDDKVTLPISRIRQSNKFPSPEPPKPVQPATQQPQRPESSGAFVEKRSVSASNSYNPFNVPNQAPPTVLQQQPLPQQQQQALEQSFQAMQIAPPTQPPQPLFPNNTGTWQQQQQAQSSLTNPFMQTLTPPISPSSQQYAQQYFQSFPTGNQYTQPDMFQQQQQQQPLQHQLSQQSPMSTGQNPFLRSVKSQEFRTSNPFNRSPVAVMPPHFTQQSQLQSQDSTGQHWVTLKNNGISPQNGFQQQQQQQVQSPGNLTATSQHQSYFSNSPVQQSPQSTGLQQYSQYPFPNQNQNQNQNPNLQAQYTYPVQSPNQFQPQQAQQQQQQQEQVLPMYAAPVSKFDKNSILALYNQPHSRLPVSIPENEVSQNMYAPQQPLQQQFEQQQRRSATMPILSSATNSHNPFGGATAATNGGGIGYSGNNHNATAAGGSMRAPAVSVQQHSRDESLAFGGAMMMNGRHSPDAFASLSARYT